MMMLWVPKRCSRISEIQCILNQGEESDTLILIAPLQKDVEEVDLDGDGVFDGPDPSVDTSILEVGTEISFQVGPIRNPMSTGAKTGFKILT